MSKRTNLANGNAAVRAGEYETAISYYQEALREWPELEELISFNLDYAKSQQRVSQTTNTLTNDNSPAKVAVFAGYHTSGKIHAYVVQYIAALVDCGYRVIYASDNPVPPEELAKISHLLVGALTVRHEEYDFGSYKRGIDYALDAGYLADANELLLCNDSCLCIPEMLPSALDSMRRRQADFWSITQSDAYCYHLQSYFLSFSRAVFLSTQFLEFFRAVKKENSVQDVIKNYELRLTAVLQSAGFEPSALIVESPPATKNAKRKDTEHFPIFMLDAGAPLVKIKSITKPQCNQEGIDLTLSRISELDQKAYSAAMELESVSQFLQVDSIKFSMIMPTHNRQHCITKAIDSVLNQTHTNFELLVVDDGSTDDTANILHERYLEEIKSGVIVYVPLPRQVGVSLARNVGLAVAKAPWISYIDTDNTIKPNFLKVFANTIVAHPSKNLFYAQLRRIDDGHVTGKPFDREALLKGNYIDLGVFVHHRDCFLRLGGFDSQLRRLVDWDLILTYTADESPHFIPHVVMEYSNDDSATDRISVRESASRANLQVQKKHTRRATVSTLVFSYNQKDYIEKALNSVISQQGEIAHQIIIADDASTDGTAEIASRYAKKYPMLIKYLPADKNLGISGNFRRGFEAADGDFVAVLEGDDYWTDSRKLERQSAFLTSRADCSMVFSKLEVFDASKKTFRTLARQDGIKTDTVTGSDFINDPSMNLLGNFSCCMFRTRHLLSMPDEIYEKRLSEIAVAFYMEKQGPIGFISDPMSVYVQHAGGIWTGSSKEEQLRSGLLVRETVRKVARPRFHAQLDEIIKKNYLEPLQALARA